MKIAEVGNIEIPQNTVNMKSRMHEEAPQTQEQDPKEALTNPMETVGRSQVNFKGARQMLTPEELNMIARMAAELKLDGHEIKVAKQALVDTMNQYKCKSLKQFNVDDLDLYIDMLTSFLDNALKIEPKINTDKIAQIFNAL